MTLKDEELKGIGIHQYGEIPSSEIAFEQEIRGYCERNDCHQYGKTWACPPAVGTVEACRQRCLHYGTAMVFNAVYPLNNPFDYKGMMKGHGAFKELCDRLYQLVKDRLPDFLLLSNEGCGRCQTCTYPDQPCRMPELLFPPVEGFGINVMRLARSAGLHYNNGDLTVTYFGMLLY